MRILRYLVPVDNFRNTILFQPGKLFMRLDGINISEKEIEPIYQPLITYERIGDYLLLEFFPFGKEILIILSFHKPFIHIERVKNDEVSYDLPRF